MTTDLTPGYLTIKQAAVYLNTSISTLQDWMRTKGLPYHKPGKTLLFNVRDLDKWMQRYRHGDRGLAVQGFVERMVR